MDLTNKELKELILRIHDQFTNQQIADMLGCHVHTFNKLIKKANLSKNLYITRSQNKDDGICCDMCDGSIILSGTMNVNELQTRLQAFSTLVKENDYEFKLRIMEKNN